MADKTKPEGDPWRWDVTSDTAPVHDIQVPFMQYGVYHVKGNTHDECEEHFTEILPLLIRIRKALG